MGRDEDLLNHVLGVLAVAQNAPDGRPDLREVQRDQPVERPPVAVARLPDEIVLVLRRRPARERRSSHRAKNATNRGKDHVFPPSDETALPC
jgi:hypothetical protein